MKKAPRPRRRRPAPDRRPVGLPPGYRATTLLVHGPSRTAKWDFSHHVVPPISSSTTYRLESVERGAEGFRAFGHLLDDHAKAPIYVYDRLDEPTRELLETELARLEGGGAAVSFASGMAAISAVLLANLSAGDEIVAHDLLYGCTHSLLTTWLPRLGVRVRRVDFLDPAAVARAITARTRVLYCETPVNPTLDVVDLAAIAAARNDAARRLRRRAAIVVDNTFQTGFGQRPFAFGADFSVYSLTKNLGGFGTDLGGAVVGPRDAYPSLLSQRKDFGGVLSSKSAWNILVYGLPTLPIRLRRQQYTALRVARALADSPHVSEVRYPALPDFPRRALAETQMRDPDGEFAPGHMIWFRLKRAHVDPVAFLDDLAGHAYSVTLAVSLGHTKTLIEMPGPMTHSAYGGRGPASLAGGIRLSIGLESPWDIVHDLSTSLKRAARRR